MYAAHHLPLYKILHTGTAFLLLLMDFRFQAWSYLLHLCNGLHGYIGYGTVSIDSHTYANSSGSRITVYGEQHLTEVKSEALLLGITEDEDGDLVIPEVEEPVDVADLDWDSILIILNIRHE